LRGKIHEFTLLSPIHRSVDIYFPYFNPSPFNFHATEFFSADTYERVSPYSFRYLANHIWRPEFKHFGYLVCAETHSAWQ
jgi:hypothetical protein